MKFNIYSMRLGEESQLNDTGYSLKDFQKYGERYNQLFVYKEKYGTIRLFTIKEEIEYEKLSKKLEEIFVCFYSTILAFILLILIVFSAFLGMPIIFISSVILVFNLPAILGIIFSIIERIILNNKVNGKVIEDFLLFC